MALAEHNVEVRAAAAMVYFSAGLPVAQNANSCLPWQAPPQESSRLAITEKEESD
jgi:hypothetical protein